MKVSIGVEVRAGGSWRKAGTLDLDVRFHVVDLSEEVRRALQRLIEHDVVPTAVDMSSGSEGVLYRCGGRGGLVYEWGDCGNGKKIVMSRFARFEIMEEPDASS